MRKWFFGILLSLFGVFSFAGDFEGVCPQFFVGGVSPVVKVSRGKLVELCNSGYATLHSGESRSPVFSAEFLTPEVVVCAAGASRVNKFAADTRLPVGERGELVDFKGSTIWDRGHVAPVGDMCGVKAREESFLLSNMGAQYFSLNRGEWARIEAEVRAGVVSSGHSVYVITGLHYEDGVEDSLKLGAGVAVPTHFYKVVFDPHTKEKKVYWSENVAPNVAVDSRGDMTYEELVTRVGIDFFPAAE